MTRWKFLLGLWGGGAAAQTVTPGRIDNFPASHWRVMNPWPENEKPVNNQCPVCGTMAPTAEKYYGRTVLGNEEMFHRRQVEGGCARCGAAFWQDAE